jgi:steroid 5-alpha reductase family enzyme
MKKTDRNALVALPIVVLIGALIALAGSQGGAKAGGVPVFALCVALAFVIQWLAFIPAFVLQTERFYDLTGSLTYIAVTIVAVLLGPAPDTRSWVLLVLVLVWAVRLGTYLFTRMRKVGKDDRFDAIKPSFIRFLNTWTLQALWVSITLAAGLAAITTDLRKGFGVLAIIGLVVWLAGFGLEATADRQKSSFRADPANKGTFIHTGVWAWSRHPNYFGEITLWVGVALIAVPVLHGWQWATLISPVFVLVLITRLSGVPMLEKKADTKWAGRPDYEAYKKRTPVLVPRPPRAALPPRSASGEAER